MDMLKSFYQRNNLYQSNAISNEKQIYKKKDAKYLNLRVIENQWSYWIFD